MYSLFCASLSAYFESVVPALFSVFSLPAVIHLISVLPGPFVFSSLDLFSWSFNSLCAEPFASKELLILPPSHALESSCQLVLQMLNIRAHGCSYCEFKPCYKLMLTAPHTTALDKYKDLIPTMHTFNNFVTDPGFQISASLSEYFFHFPICSS